AEADFAGDGVDFDAAATCSYAGAERMLALLFDDHRNVGFDFLGDGVGGEMEIGVGGNAEVHGAGGGLEIPITRRARIALHIDAAGRRLRFHVAGGAFDAHGAAGGGSFDAPAGVGDLCGTRKRADPDVALNVGDGDRAGSAVGAQIVADIVGAHRTAERRDMRFPLDVFHGNRAGSRFGLHRAAHGLNGLRAGEHRGGDFGFVRDFNHIRNAEIAHAAAHFFTDANGVAALFDGRVGNELADALFRGVEAHTGRASLGVNVHFAVRAAGDGDVAGSVVELKA